MNKNTEKVVTESGLRALLKKLFAWLPFKKTKNSLFLVTMDGTEDGEKVFDITRKGDVCVYNKDTESGENKQVSIKNAALEQITPDEIDNIIKFN